MESYGTNGDSNLTFNGTLNAATNSTPAYRVRVENTPERMVESIVSVIRGLQETTAALTFLIRNNLALMIPVKFLHFTKVSVVLLFFMLVVLYYLAIYSLTKLGSLRILILEKDLEMITFFSRIFPC